MEQIFVGIDISKDKSTYIAIDNNGTKILGPITVANSKVGIDKIIDMLKAHYPDDILFAMEVSSNYWENICSHLKDKNYKAICLNPYQVKKYRQALGKRIKTDSIDAAAIAELAGNTGTQEMFISSDEALNLKELVRVKHSFEDRVKRLKKSVLSALSLVFPEYTSITFHPFSKVSTKLLKTYPTAVHFASSASVSKLVKIFRKYQGCNFEATKAKELTCASKNSFYLRKSL